MGGLLFKRATYNIGLQYVVSKQDRQSEVATVQVEVILLGMPAFVWCLYDRWL